MCSEEVLFLKNDVSFAEEVWISLAPELCYFLDGFLEICLPELRVYDLSTLKGLNFLLS
jgi:hypothetical protein